MSKVKAFFEYLKKTSTQAKLNILILVIVALVTIVTSTTKKEVQAETTTATVTVITTSGGSVKLGPYDKDNDGRNYIEGATSYTFNVGDYCIINATNDEGYDFLGWYSSNGDYIVENSTSKTKYFTVVKDVTFYAYFKNDSQHVVTYITSQILNNILGIEIVDDGQPAPQEVKALKKSGFNFKSWSQDLSSVEEDISVFPTYKYSIFTVIRDYWSFFLTGLLKTLLFSVISVFLSLLFGAIICFIRISKIKVISFIGTAYVEVIRGVPSLLLLLIVYAVVPRINIGFLNTEIIACILALFINSSAYMAEIYRSGIQAVDKGQMEAARALGISYPKAMFKVIIPQAIKNVLPSIGNELIMVIKETSLASQIDAGIGELMSVKRQITAVTYINLEPYFIIAFIYFIVTFSLSKVVGKIEKRLDSHEH